MEIKFLNLSEVTNQAGNFFPAGKSEARLNKANAKASLELSDLPVYQNVLLLQGPVGPFFSKLAQFLRQRGATTYKINFNPGDQWFYSAEAANTFLYDFKPEYWPQYLERLIVQNQIGAVFIFGDCRPIHLPAKALCQQYGIDLWVFEEGYYRPSHFTMEYFGVNAHSSLCKKTTKELLSEDSLLANNELSEQTVFNRSHFYMTRNAIIYWLMNIIQPFKCANYDHHRQLNFLISYQWIKNFFTYWLYKCTDHFRTKRLFDQQSLIEEQFFLLPLQVHNDAQMTRHSDFESVDEVIQLVVTSFHQYLSINKNSTSKLIIKHHPMDRGHKNYAELIKRLSNTLGIKKGRILYLHELDLNRFFLYCKGCITVNSTLGLKALKLNVPVKNLGRSFYDKQGITSQKTLDQFWQNPGAVNQGNIEALERVIIKNTQVNGCLYSPEYQIK